MIFEQAVIPLLKFFVVRLLEVALLGFSTPWKLVWCGLVVGSSAFALRVVDTTAFANKSATKPGVAAGINSTFEVSLKHYDF